MFHTTNLIPKATVAVAIAVSLAALTASQAFAGGGSSTYHDGWYGWVVAQTRANHQQSTIDGRSPDTIDAAFAARQREQQLLDKTVLDGRAPDTIDAAVQAHSPVVTVVRSPGFEWRDFGIGVVAACGAMLLLGLAIRLLTARQAHKHPSSVATA